MNVVCRTDTSPKRNSELRKRMLTEHVSVRIHWREGAPRILHMNLYRCKVVERFIRFVSFDLLTAVAHRRRIDFEFLSLAFTFLGRGVQPERHDSSNLKAQRHTYSLSFIKEGPGDQAHSRCKGTSIYQHYDCFRDCRNYCRWRICMDRQSKTPTGFCNSCDQ